MDSFVLAETFKYLYLLFADKGDVPVDTDDYVFTTEAHLLPLYLALVSWNCWTGWLLCTSFVGFPQACQYMNVFFISAISGGRASNISITLFMCVGGRSAHTCTWGNILCALCLWLCHPVQNSSGTVEVFSSADFMMNETCSRLPVKEAMHAYSPSLYRNLSSKQAMSESSTANLGQCVFSQSRV